MNVFMYGTPIFWHASMTVLMCAIAGSRTAGSAWSGFG